MDFSVDPAALRSGGRSIESTRAGSEGHLRRLHGETATGARAAWGTDLATGAVYEELARLSGEALDLIGAAMVHSGSGIQRTADAYEHADGAARDGFGGICRPA